MIAQALTKEEFRELWAKPDCPITVEQTARCYVEWGLGHHPKTKPMDRVIYRVLVAAGVPDAEDYNPDNQDEDENHPGYIPND